LKTKFDILKKKQKEGRERKNVKGKKKQKRRKGKENGNLLFLPIYYDSLLL
jgi:hypothetical protein